MIEDEARHGHPFSVRNEGLVAKVRERIQEERCATVRMMADEFGVNPSAWGLLKPSSYCDVGRFFYRVFKFGAKLCRSLFKIM